jgi:nitrite reductase/ring-hydroxylating ferredoxin subunit
LHNPFRAKELFAQGVTMIPDVVRICSQSELPGTGEVREFTAAGRAFCVANLNGTISVLDGVCPHEGGSLGEGSIEEGRVVCPWHGYTFDLRTGVSEQDSELKADVLPATVVEGELRVKI